MKLSGFGRQGDLFIYLCILYYLFIWQLLLFLHSPGCHAPVRYTSDRQGAAKEWTPSHQRLHCFILYSSQCNFSLQKTHLKYQLDATVALLIKYEEWHFISSIIFYIIWSGESKPLNFQQSSRPTCSFRQILTKSDSNCCFIAVSHTRSHARIKC